LVDEIGLGRAIRSENGQQIGCGSLRISRMNATPRAVAGVYHGWLVVGAAFVVALFGWGLGFYGPGIYLVALQNRHGWSTPAVSSAITTYYLLGATLVFFAGTLFERLGVRRIVMAGTVAMACGVVLLTLISEFWQIYAAFAVMSLGWAAMSGAAINIIVAAWFDKRRGLAVSLALNGASAGGVVIAPLLIVLIGRFGLTAALSSVAGVMLVILLPTVALVLRSKRSGERDHTDDVSRSAQPELRRDAPAGDGPIWQSTVLRSRNFQTISAPFALGLTAQVGFLTHQVAYLSPVMGVITAGWAVSLTTFSAVAGRIVMGLFVDKVDRRIAACGNFCIQIVGTGLLTSNMSVATLYLGCILFGLGVGNMISLPVLIVQQEFPKQDFSRIVSWIVAINQFTFAFGPGLLGYLRRAEDSYTTALLACLVMQAAAALIVVSPVLGRMLRRPSGKDARR
jgi:MFS family permease